MELGDFNKRWPAKAASTRWHAITVDRTDSGELQHIRIDAACPIFESLGVEPAVDSMSVLDADGITILGATPDDAVHDDGTGVQAHFRLFGENNLPKGGRSVGALDADNKTYYVVVTRNAGVFPPQGFDYQVRWDTDLSWFMNSTYAHKYSDGTAVSGWRIALDGETQDDWPSDNDEISLQWQIDLGHPKGLNFVDMDIDDNTPNLPVVLGPSLNVWGEPVEARQGLRYVQSFQARIWEWDSWANGDNDKAPWGKVAPMFQADLQSIPDPATANRFIQSFNVKIGWGENDGNYQLRANRANSSPRQFCIRPPHTCTDDLFCCSRKTVCAPVKDNEDTPGGACHD